MMIPRRNRKADLASLSINVGQAVALAGFIWAAATWANKLEARVNESYYMLGDTKSDVGKLQARTRTVESAIMSGVVIDVCPRAHND
jgi:hypothetical protein